jgi:hypothetical protein
VIAPAASDKSSDTISRADVIAAADDAFVAGIRLAEVTGVLVALVAFVVGWFAFPRRREQTPHIDRTVPT